MLIVHGGPGGGSIRPCGASTTRSTTASCCSTSAAAAARRRTRSLENNTTWHLVADMERLREHLGIERWQVFGGSWGSTLALAYAETHPERVTALVLRGIFLLRQSELEWFYQEAAAAIFPDAWEAYEADPAERARRHDRAPTTGGSPIPTARCSSPAAEPGASGKARRCRCSEDPERITQASPMPSLRARLRAHRMPLLRQPRLLRRDGELLADADRLAAIPGTIVHGRYDVVTPVKNAWDLKKAWPRGRVADRPRRRPCHDRARHHPRARRCHARSLYHALTAEPHHGLAPRAQPIRQVRAMSALAPCRRTEPAISSGSASIHRAAAMRFQ